MHALELLAASVSINTVKGVIQEAGAFAAEKRGILCMERPGILQQTGTAKRDRVYRAKALLGILEGRARLTPGG